MVDVENLKNEVPPNDAVDVFVEEEKHASLEKKAFDHQLSVSEATEQNYKGLTAPFFLRWLEIPFNVPNPVTKVKLPEAAGWGMDSVGRGPLNQAGTYFGAAVIRLASAQAGCKNPAACNNTVYGFKPSSLLTLMTSVIGVVAAVLMPVVGAAVDHTSYRRSMGAVSGFLAVTLVGVEIFLSSENWFAMLIIDTIQTFFFLVHTAAVFAYLPDLSLDENVLSHYTSRFNMRQFCGQFCYVGLIIITAQIRLIGTPSGTVQTLAFSVQTSRDACGIAFGIGALFVGYAWIFLFRSRPPLSKVPEGSSVMTAGFKRVGTTFYKVWTDYRHLRWFLVSLLFSPEAGAGVVLSIAVTFLTVFMKMPSVDIAVASLILMAGNVVGSLFSKPMCRWVNPLNSYRLGLFSLGAAIGLSALVFTGPERKNSVFGFAALWGVFMGWVYPSQRVLFCTLIPKGQETEFMGLFVFVGSILGWLPALLFTIMNESGVSIRWGLPLVSFFCLISVFFTLFMGRYDDARDRVAMDSEEKLKAIEESIVSKFYEKNSDVTTESVEVAESTAPMKLDDVASTESPPPSSNDVSTEPNKAASLDGKV